jgi:hypothetical protein
MSERKQVRIYQSALDGKYYKYTGNPDRTHEFYNAGIVTPTDIADVQAVVILDEVMGRARPNYTLRSLCRIIPMEQLVCTIDLATGFTVQRKVPPLVEAEISKDAYSTITFNLWKNVGHVVVSDEAGMKARHPILSESIDECARDLPRAENLDIKDASDTITEKVASAAYSDWGAKTSGVSNTDPFDAIIPHIDYIQGKGRPVDFLAMHPTLWGKFIRNTFVRDLVHAGIAAIGATGGNFTLPGYPTVRIVTDYALTETPDGTHGPILGSSRGLVLGQGPTMAAQYRDEKAGYDGYIIRQWLQPKVIIQDALSKICT